MNKRLIKPALYSFILFSICIMGFQVISFNEPTFSLEDYQVEDGFELSLAASEPFLKAPVSIDFDNKGRIWAVEMIGYMPNLEGMGEDIPNGRISILEDLDKDGVIDHSKIFLDKLVLPRGLAHVYGGLLYVDGSKLWFVEIEKDKPGKKTLVDAIYAEGGNVEHSSNGLMMNIDNWIYSAKYNFRYQLKHGKWLKEPTSYRGQWGITKDNFGRLYFNSNGTQLKGDYVLANKAIQNRYFKPVIAENQKLASNRVFPIHQTSVNRGYQMGTLDKRGYLMNVTAACGPLVYRGGAFLENYNQNVFTCEPAANLIKRNVMTFENIRSSGKQAIEGKEFIASTDEGFRPVNLFNGPDGAIYVVDMHRGIIQHKAYISQYLTAQLGIKRLATLQNAGRILKIRNKAGTLNAVPNLARSSSKELVAFLSHPNGWIRDRSQQMLIQKKDRSVLKDLVNLAQNSNEFSTAIHALYVLEGLNSLTLSTLNDIISQSKQPETIAHALGLLERFASIKNVSKMKEASVQLLARNSEVIDLYLAMSLNSWLKLSESDFLPILSEIDTKYNTQKIFQEAVVSSLEGIEEKYLNTMNPSPGLKSNLSIAISNHKNEELNSIFVKEKNVLDARTKGLRLYRTICATCHGVDGKGVQDLAPPLKGSEYIDGSMKRLAAIILHGISGPIHVDGTLYELNNEMPGLVNNNEISDQDISDIIRFTQNAFAKIGKGTSADDVREMRGKKPKGSGVFNEKQLLEMEF